MLITTTLHGVLLGAFLSPIPPQDKPAEPAQSRERPAISSAAEEAPDLLALTDGTLLQGKVLKVEKERVVMSLPRLGIDEVGIPFSKLSSASLYVALRDHTQASEDEVHMILATFAIEKQLYHQALQELELAARANPALAPQIEKRIEDVRRAGAQHALALGEQLERAGELERARDRYRSVLEDWGVQELQAEARSRLERVEPAIEARAQVREQQTQKKALAKERDELSRWREMYERGQAALHRALQNAGNLGEEEDQLLLAAQIFRRVLDQIGAGGDTPVAPEREAFLTSVRYALLDAYVALGHHHIVAGDPLAAHRYAALAQAIDPEDPKVLNLRLAVAAASARPVRR